MRAKRALTSRAGRAVGAGPRPRDRGAGARRARPGAAAREPHMCEIIASPNPEHVTCVAPGISRAKS